ncbi:MAG TPA: rhodanese-like domain-containing protein [Salinimicrobium sp.]|nr:rhodanese-like domain-containing protein [Salinimicrobium sp.]
MKDLTQEEWRKQIQDDKNSAILDVRTEAEVEEGKIPGAKNIDIYKGQEFLDEIEKLDKSKNYYIYCRSGGRSAQAAAIMGQKGFNNTYNLLGGFSEWNGEVEE